MLGLGSTQKILSTIIKWQIKAQSESTINGTVPQWKWTKETKQNIKYHNEYSQNIQIMNMKCATSKYNNGQQMTKLKPKMEIMLVEPYAIR